MLRLGCQGIELLTTRRLTLPIPEPQRSYLLDVHRSKVSEQACVARAEELEHELSTLSEPRAGGAGRSARSKHGCATHTAASGIYESPE